MAESGAAGFLDIIAEECGRPVRPEERIEHLGLDSLEFVDLAIRLNVPALKAVKCYTVQDLLDAIPN